MDNKSKEYWNSNLKIVSILLVIWFLVSFGFGILFSDTLDQIKIGGFKLGFWFAQQGSIYIFVLLIFAYVYLMQKLDEKISQEEDSDE
jgi:putative solute:sodium symporter small subunit|tara:strand:+ start:4653 stop:4916 length:264 start_codon:yes stop_codon:yes gene_type:complete